MIVEERRISTEIAYNLIESVENGFTMMIYLLLIRQLDIHFLVRFRCRLLK